MSSTGNRYFRRRGRSGDELAPVCGHAGCRSKLITACSEHNDWSGRCGTAWCDEHVTLVAGSPYCPTHAAEAAREESPATVPGSPLKARSTGSGWQPASHLSNGSAGIQDHCAREGCAAHVVWPCNYQVADGASCGASWCLEHVEFVGQARYCQQHAELIGSRIGACSQAGCGEREVWVCNSKAGGASCGTQWCRDHLTFIGLVPFCSSHSGHATSPAPVSSASAVASAGPRALASGPAAQVPDAGDRCRGLAQLVCEGIHDELLQLMRARHGDRPDVTVSADDSVREVWYQRRPVWWRTWGAFTSSGYLSRVAVWLPMSTQPAEAVVSVLVDGRVVFQEAPPWGAGGTGDFPDQADLVSLRAQLMGAVRATLDPPIAAVQAEPPGPLPAAESAYTEPPAPPDGQTPIATKLRVVVMAEDEHMIADVTALIGEVSEIEILGSRLDPDAVITQASSRWPDVIVAGLTSERVDGAALVKRLRAHLPSVPVLLVADNRSSKSLLQARAAGAHDLLIWPFAGGELVLAIKRAAGLIELEAHPAAHDTIKITPVAPVHDTIDVRSQASRDPALGAITTAQALVPSDSPPEIGSQASSNGHSVRGGHVTAVFSGKGGVGKSLIAMNLAAALAEASNQEAGLVDLDLQFGDLALLLGVKPTPSMSDVVAGYPGLDDDFLRELMSPAGGHIRLLPATTSPELAELVSQEHVRALLTGLRNVFEHIVVDCGSHLDDRSLEVIQSADSLVLVTDLTLPTMKNAKLALALLAKLQFPSHRIFVAVNRADVEGVVGLGKVEALLRHAVAVHLPTVPDRLLHSAVQQGSPIFGLFPQSDLTAKMKDLVSRLGYSRAEAMATLHATARR